MAPAADGAGPGSGPAVLSPAQRAFVDLLVERAALKFGDFTLKSGRRSPYFVNTGCFSRGSDLAALGGAYADAIRRQFGDEVQVVFGPAYKGIPLALGAAQGYERLVGRPVGWAYDRKEAKDHGDGGLFVGAPLTPGLPVVLVDDVITAGTAVRETMAKLAPLQLRILGVVVALDRQERGTGAGGLTAIAELAAEFHMPVVATITITQACDHLQALGRMDAALRGRIDAYLGR
jgi:orotate phosphoribosyltransferase